MAGLTKSDQYRGWLYKWTNYIKGYQKRWFVLQNGLLSYYRNPAEISYTCRGTVNLASAFIHTQDACSMVISDGGTRTFHLKASSEVERQQWVTALELAKAKAITTLESDEEEVPGEQPDKNELQQTLKTLSTKLEDIQTCSELLTKHQTALQRTLGDLEKIDGSTDPATRVKAANERATLFRITCNAMIKACRDYVDLAQSQGKRWQKLLQYEHEQRLRLEEMVEQLAKQHSALENRARRSMANVQQSAGVKQAGDHLESVKGEDEDDEDDEFHDALGDQVEEWCFTTPPSTVNKGHRRNASNVSNDSVSLPQLQMDEYNSSDSDSEVNNGRGSTKVVTYKSKAQSLGDVKRSSSQNVISSNNNNVSQKAPSSPANSRPQSRVPKQRRKTIPDKPNYSINLWSIMKNCIGKELSKIPMPVNFSEPISFLQRLTEDFEYSDCLDRAAACSDSCEQMAYVAAFTVSSYATTTTRTLKPFNPLLGETYEFDRTDDLGWKSFAEQVSHHPPIVAMHTQGKGWSSWQEFTMLSKFRGKYLQIIPIGIAHLEFHKSGNHYTWRKVTTTVHNIIVGRLWVDNHGEMDITNHKNGDKCHLKYTAYSYFSKETPRKVAGIITDSASKARWVVQGTWDDKLEGSPVLKSDESKGKLVYETGDKQLLWQRRYPPPELEKLYNFTQLAIELNEMEEGVAPTDSRYRPDQRLMEEGKWDDANATKVQLEEKQRAARRQREQEAANGNKAVAEYEPKWFRKQIDPQTGNIIHLYTDEYWSCKERQDWSRCPDIYL